MHWLVGFLFLLAGIFNSRILELGIFGAGSYGELGGLLVVVGPDGDFDC